MADIVLKTLHASPRLVLTRLLVPKVTHFSNDGAGQALEISWDMELDRKEEAQLGSHG